MAVGPGVLSPESTLEKNHPTGELRKALATYFAMSFSTSGVEQKFSRAQLKFHSRIAATPLLEDMALKVMQDASEYNNDKGRQNRLTRIARKAWLCCFQRSRLRLRHRRIDFGINRSIAVMKKTYRGSERAFIRKRRGAAASAAAAVSAGSAASAAAAGSAAGPPGGRLAGWSESHTEELEKQIEKRRQRRLDLVAEGDAGATTAERAAILQQDRKRVGDQRARERKAKRNAVQVDGLSIAQCLHWLQGKCAWVCPECRSEELARSLARLGMTRMRRVVGARVMVVPCPSEAMQSNSYRLPAALLGCCLISPSLLKSDSDVGRAVMLRSAIAKTWSIWISCACATKHVAFWALVKDCMDSTTDCCWKLHFSSEVDDDWTPLKDKFKNKPSNLLAVVSSAEIGDGRFAGWKNTMTMADFTEKKIVEVESTIHGF